MKIKIDKKRNVFTYDGEDYPPTMNNLIAYKKQDPNRLSKISLDL